MFSNSVAPTIVAASLKVLDLLSASPQLREQLHRNKHYFRGAMQELGFSIPAGEHPIVPIMIGDAGRAGKMANLLLEQGIYVVGFSYPVVPQGKARIRVQMSAAHTSGDLAFAVEQFGRVKRELAI
jgi:glycine C-acetyltransferase